MTLQEQEIERLRQLKVSADAALEAMGEELERVLRERDEFRDRLEKLASWYGHDREAALGIAPTSRQSGAIR